MPIAGQLVALEKDSYRLVRRIGTESSFGTVWLARRIRQSVTQEVALKFVSDRLLREAAPDQVAHWRAHADAERAFLLQMNPWDSQHIVRLLDSGDDDGVPVLALELMATDLSCVLAAAKQAGQVLPAPLTLSWLQQVNHALARVHDRGWRYLDLKPANLLLDSTHKCVKLSDFGSNRSLAVRPEHSFVGTPGWQAPEQVLDSAGGSSSRSFLTDVRADYFALGLLFYTLVTGGQSLKFATHCRLALAEQNGTVSPSVDPHLTTGGGCALTSDEEERFLNCFAASMVDSAPVDDTWCAARRDSVRSTPVATQLALGLLKRLLAWSPDARPSHEGQIAREIFNIRRTLARSSSTAENQPPIASPATSGRKRIQDGLSRPREMAATLMRRVSRWLTASLISTAIGLTALTPAHVSAKTSQFPQGAIDLPSCRDLVTSRSSTAVRLGIVQPSNPSLVEHAALLSRTSENLHLCSSDWDEVLPSLRPWTTAPGLDRGVGWVALAAGLVLTLVLCARFAPRSWWRGGPSLAGWGALALGTFIAGCVFMSAFKSVPWARGLIYAHVVSIQTGLGAPEWSEVSGAAQLDRLLATKPLATRTNIDSLRAGVARHPRTSHGQNTKTQIEDHSDPIRGDLYRARQALNLRSGPGVHFSRSRTLQIGAFVRPTGAGRGDWWEVQEDGYGGAPAGWVSSLWLRRVGASALAEPAPMAISPGTTLSRH